MVVKISRTSASHCLPFACISMIRMGLYPVPSSTPYLSIASRGLPCAPRDIPSPRTVVGREGTANGLQRLASGAGAESSHCSITLVVCSIGSSFE